jgi:hypothetical protein
MEARSCGTRHGQRARRRQVHGTQTPRYPPFVQFYRRCVRTGCVTVRLPAQAADVCLVTLRRAEVGSQSTVLGFIGTPSTLAAYAGARRRR